MRGEICIGFATLLSLASFLFLTFVYVGQINSSLVPGAVSMASKKMPLLTYINSYTIILKAKVDVSGYRGALNAAFEGVDPINGLYTQDPHVALGKFAGLRQQYKFGVRSYCAYVDGKRGTCSHLSNASKFRPYSAITSDMPLNYSQFSNAVIPVSTFRDDATLGSFSRTASTMLMLSFIFVGLALVLGIVKSSCTFFFAALSALLASLFLLISAALWTVAVNKAKSINGLQVEASSTANSASVGITVTTGPGVYLVWTAFACMTLSILPYMITQMSYRS